LVRGLFTPTFSTHEELRAAWQRARAVLAESAPDQRDALEYLMRHLQAIVDAIAPGVKGD
jgi:hypothetical protein